MQLNRLTNVCLPTALRPLVLNQETTCHSLLITQFVYIIDIHTYTYVKCDISINLKYIHIYIYMCVCVYVYIKVWNTNICRIRSKLI